MHRDSIKTVVLSVLAVSLCVSTTVSTQGVCSSPAAIDMLGVGCGITVGGSMPVVGSVEQLNMRSNLGNSLGWVLITPAGAPTTSIENCNVFLDLTAVVAVTTFTTDSGGDALVDIGLPPRSNLCGRQFVVQVLVSSSGPLSFGALSNGIKFTLGD